MENIRGKSGRSDRFYFVWAPKSLQMILQPCSGKKAMTNLDGVLNSRDITLLTKVHIVKAMGFFRSYVWISSLWKKSWGIDVMLSNCGAGEDSWESLGQQGDQSSQSGRKLTLNIHWKDWCWSSNSLATWFEEVTHWKRPWCRERLKAEGKGGSRGWAGWMASLTQWTGIWTNSGR